MKVLAKRDDVKEGLIKMGRLIRLNVIIVLKIVVTNPKMVLLL